MIHNYALDRCCLLRWQLCSGKLLAKLGDLRVLGDDLGFKLFCLVFRHIEVVAGGGKLIHVTCEESGFG